MQNIFTLETKKYAIKIENFEGPLDLLCHLIDVNKMDIYDVNIAEITDQYIDYINKMEEMDLELTSEFLVMATNLLNLKSKKLLPHVDENEEMLSEEELIARIIEYKSYKEITAKFKEMYTEANKRVFRVVPEKIDLPKLEMQNKFTSNEIYETYKDIIEKNKNKLNKNAKNIEKIAIVEHFNVKDMTKKIATTLLKKSQFIFNKLFSVKKCSKEEIVTAFLSLLEMSREDKVTTDQETLFGDITVKNKNKNKKQ